MSRNAAKSSTYLAPDKPAISTKRHSSANWVNVTQFVATAIRCERGVACIDLDSVLLYHNPEDGISRLGRPLPLGRKLTHLLKHKGFRVIVLTSRPARYQHGRIHQHLESLGFMVDRVTNIKPAADAYFDDKAFRIPKNWR